VVSHIAVWSSLLVKLHAVSRQAHEIAHLDPKWNTESMSVDILVAEHDHQEKDRRRALALRVMTLVDVPTPDYQVLCFLDSEDSRYLKSQNGEVNRGIHFDDPDPEVRHCVLGRLETLNEPERRADYRSLVYLHGSTCSTDVGLCITLAHELQHLKQSVGIRPEYVASQLIGRCDEIVCAHALIWSDVPHEREARIVSKRVATRVFGTDTVREYVDRQISDAVSKMNAASSEKDKELWSNDAADWLFIRRVSGDLDYDLVREIRELYRNLGRFRRELEATQRFFGLGGVDLTTLFNGCGI
jgi:hypothetical protein